jgi:hypothetical protein
MNIRPLMNVLWMEWISKDHACGFDQLRSLAVEAPIGKTLGVLAAAFDGSGFPSTRRRA